jgi:hypothetical protein
MTSSTSGDTATAQLAQRARQVGDGVPRAADVEEARRDPGLGGRAQRRARRGDEPLGGGGRDGAVVDVEPDRAPGGGRRELGQLGDRAAPAGADVEAEPRAAVAAALLDGADRRIAAGERGGEPDRDLGVGRRGADLRGGLAADDRAPGGGGGERGAGAAGRVGDRDRVHATERGDLGQLGGGGDVEAGEPARGDRAHLGPRERLRGEQRGDARRAGRLGERARVRLDPREVEHEARPRAAIERVGDRSGQIRAHGRGEPTGDRRRRHAGPRGGLAPSGRPRAAPACAARRAVVETLRGARASECP